MQRDYHKKKYQIFISSTYSDLKEERKVVTEAILELGHMPYGMEVFPAANASQWEWIKQAIDESDYYIVIIGGKYGSIKPDTGLSYTESEYNYAIRKGIPSIAFIIDESVDLPKSKIETDSEKEEKLNKFKKHISETRLCKFYKSPQDLKANVYPSLLQLITNCPREGWVKANAIKYHDNIRQREEVPERDGKELAQGGDIYKITYHLFSIVPDDPDCVYTGTVCMSWDNIFYYIANMMYYHLDEDDIYIDSDQISHAIRELIIENEKEKLEKSGYKLDSSVFSVENSDIEMIIIQLEALNYICQKSNLSWDLTKQGRVKYLGMRAIKRQ